MKYKIGILGAALMVLFAVGAGATANKVVGYQTYIGATADTSGLTVDPGSVYIARDTGKRYIHDGSGWVLEHVTTPSDTSTVKISGFTITPGDSIKARVLPNAVTKADTVSFAAVGHTIAFPTLGMKSLTAAVTVNADTIGFQLQGKKIGNNWGTLDNANDSTYAANETVSLRFEAPSHYDSIRVNISSKRSALRSVIVGISKEWK